MNKSNQFAFHVSHFKERDDFIRVTKKGLLLDKANFSGKGYEIDELKYPQNQGCPDVGCPSDADASDI
jgi:hypothetical protein